MTENNRKQAYIIKDSLVLQNDVGTAPGVLCEIEGKKIIVLLPGPPQEMQKMWTKYAKPEIQKHTNGVFVSKNINIVGMGEAAVAYALNDIMINAKNPTVAPYCKTSETRLRITASAEDEASAAQMCDEMIERIKATEVGKYIYGIDTDLSTALVEALRQRELKIATAESCTGGLLAKMITDVCGSSDVFDGGMVTYSNAVKFNVLGVSGRVLNQYGPYDRRVSQQMAEGVKRVMEADIGVGITGIAGPDGGTEDKPVGTVYISIAYGKKSETKKFKFGSHNSRERIREQAAVNAIIMVLNAIKD